LQAVRTSTLPVGEIPTDEHLKKFKRTKKNPEQDIAIAVAAPNTRPHILYICISFRYIVFQIVSIDYFFVIFS
jgi:hypothetical protein